jgi:hypothetical protein
LSSATYVFDLKGNSGSCQVINVTGDSNTITIIQTANKMGSFNFTLYGSHNTLTIEWQGKTSANMDINIYGSNNTYQYGASGTFNGNTVGIVTSFIGEPEPPGTTGCPYTNLASTDKVGALKTSGTSDTQSLLFYNSQGTNTAPHSVTPAGDPALTWQNTSEPPTVSRCAFGGTGPTGIFSPFLYGAGSVSTLMQNAYLNPQTLSIEGGAIIDGQASGAIMIDPPAFNFSTNSITNSARLTLISFVETSSRTATGYSTAGVVTQLLSETIVQASFPLTVAGTAILVDPALNITTAYPAAWLGYFQGLAPTYLNGTIGCSSTVSIASPYTCLNPPPGQYVSLFVPLNIQ